MYDSFPPCRVFSDKSVTALRRVNEAKSMYGLKSWPETWYINMDFRISIVQENFDCGVFAALNVFCVSMEIDPTSIQPHETERYRDEIRRSILDRNVVTL